MSGFDSNSLNYGLLFSLTMEEATGTAITGDAAKPHHTTTLTHAPVWTQLPSGVWVMLLQRAGPDYLSCSAASTVDLDFTTGAFSGFLWQNWQSEGLYSTWINKYSGAANGWQFWMSASGEEYITTNNVSGVSTYTPAGTIPNNVWCLIGFTRNGTSCRVYKNGLDVSTSIGSHPNLASSAADNLIIGQHAVDVGRSFNGYMWNPRIWNRALSPEEVNWMFQRERWMFRV